VEGAKRVGDGVDIEMLEEVEVVDYGGMISRYVIPLRGLGRFVGVARISQVDQRILP
jgi:hypothetical protein